MRIIEPDFQSHLDSGATTLATCWRIERRDGVVIGFTDHDRNLTFGGVDYLAATGAQGAAIDTSADLAVDNSEIEGVFNTDALRAEDLLAGRYDGATIDIYRVNWANPDMHIHLKSGFFGEVEKSGDRFRAEFRGLSQSLDQPVGRLYQRLCDADLGDERCRVDLSNNAFTATAIVTERQSDEGFVAEALSGFEENWFANGLLTWAGGANSGESAHVKTHGGAGAIGLWRPTGAPISVGDQFTIHAGCDKRLETCRAKFANAINFRGFPTMPGNDFVISYPLRSEKNDGGRRR